MGIDLDHLPKEPISLEQYATDIVQRLPLRSVHPVHLPGVVMHHTKKRSGVLKPDEYCEKIWSAGRWLASYILKHSDEFKGKRVLDIGTGSGIVAIAAALAGAEVTALDCNAKAIRLAKINAKANGVSIKTIEQYITDRTPLADFEIVTLADTMYSDFVSDACVQAFRSEAKSTLANRAFYICDQSGWTEGQFYIFKEKIMATGARFRIMKGGKTFPSYETSSNNNPITAVRIDIAP